MVYLLRLVQIATILPCLVLATAIPALGLPVFFTLSAILLFTFLKAGAARKRILVRRANPVVLPYGRPRRLHRA